MGPRQFAADNINPCPPAGRRSWRASMGPRQFAADNHPSQGKAHEVEYALQWGRGNLPRITRRVAIGIAFRDWLQWGRGNLPRITGLAQWR